MRRRANEIQNSESLIEEVECTNNPNILLGNGFNICLGIKTSYKSLFESLITYDHIKRVMNLYEGLEEKIKQNNFNLEAYQNELEEMADRSTVITEFYRIILKRCRTKYKHKEVISFLLSFKKFFTTNYDPLLYRFLLQSSKSDINNDVFYRDLVTIHSGSISNITISNDIPLKAITQKQVYDIALQIFKDKKIHQDKKREEYYGALRKIRGEPEMKINDGFVISQPNEEEKETKKKYKAWDFNGQQEQNIYYLHGAMHIYKENNQIRKMILKKSHHDKIFINEILDVTAVPSCVFEKKHQDKLIKIKKNQYLKFCLDSLKKATESLFIIGWSCKENDRHLIDVINESRLEKLYVSYYSDQTKEEYRKAFPEKSLFFFNANLLPFKKIRHNRASL